MFCPPNVVAHGDVIGFTWNDDYVTGSVIALGTVRYPDNKVRPLEWHIHVKTEGGEIVSAAFDHDDRIELLAMDDSTNPARTRNHEKNWKSLGITR